MPCMFDVKVVPNAGKIGCLLDKFGKLKFFLKSPAQDGKANKELIKLIAKALRVPQNSISIVRGATGRNKTIRIEYDITFDKLLIGLGIDIQTDIFE